MKTKEIAIKYNVNQKLLEEFLKYSKYNFKESLVAGMIVDDNEDMDSIIADYKVYEANKLAEEANERKKELEKQEKIRKEQERLRKEEEKKRRALANMLITSGFSFDGYTIKKYSGYISGDDVIQIPRGTNGFFTSATNVGDKLMESLTVIRRNALHELKEAAYALGCNAVIGVDFDYLTLDPETANSRGGTTYLPYIFGVTANGNAVIIEKDEE